MKNHTSVRLGGSEAVHALEIGPTTTVDAVLRAIVAAGKLDSNPGEIHLFEEDAETELPRDQVFSKPPKGLHAHRCRRVRITFHHVDDDKSENFPPATTIGRLLEWCRHHFKVDKDAKYALRLTPDSDPLPQAAHVGVYVQPDTCSLTLYFAPACKILG